MYHTVTIINKINLDNLRLFVTVKQYETMVHVANPEIKFQICHGLAALITYLRIWNTTDKHCRSLPDQWFEWEICDYIYSVGSSSFDREECLASTWLFICSCDVRNYTGNPYADLKVIRHAWLHLVSLPVSNKGKIQQKNHNFIDNEPTFSVEILCYSNFFFWKFFCILQSHC